MKLIDLTNIFNLKRYKRCKKIFKNPLSAHFKTSFSLSNKPYKLDFINGGIVEFTNPKKTKSLWKYLLSKLDSPLPIKVIDKNIVFNYRGLKLTIRPNSIDFFTFREICIHDTYKINSLPEQMDVVIDLGTNIGLFTALISQKAKKIISLEPVEANRLIAIKNIKGANAENNVSLHGLAIGGKTAGTVRIHKGYKSSGNSLIAGSKFVNSEEEFEEVSLISLIDLFEKEQIEKCDFLKCDIEGAEFEVFLKAPKKILEKIQRVAIEIHISPPQLTIEHWKELKNKLMDCGFELTIEGEIDQSGGVFMVFGEKTPPSS